MFLKISRGQLPLLGCPSPVAGLSHCYILSFYFCVEHLQVYRLSVTEIQISLGPFLLMFPAISAE